VESSSSLTATIFDLDGSVVSQPRLLSRLGDRVETVDMRALGPSVRCLPTKQAADELDRVVASVQPRQLSFFGSGDFHHVTDSVLKRLTEPVSLIVFDHHSDWIGWSIFPCGAWLIEALKLPNVERIVSIGVGSTSIAGWKVCHGPVKEIFSGRIEFYPRDCKSSRCLGRRSGSPACAVVKPRLFSTDIYWKTIAETDWRALISGIVDGLPTSKVYISIDKDCLNTDHAFTNWDAGPLTLSQLVEAIAILKERKEVVGVDICGEYSEVKVENPFLQGLAHRFHPKIPLPSAQDLEKNEDTNIALLEALQKL